MCPNIEWTTLIPSIDAAIAVQADAADTIYVVGTTGAGPTDDAWIGAFDEATGAMQWSATLDPTEAGVADVHETAFGLGLHSSGDLIIGVGRDDLATPAAVVRFDAIALAIDWFRLLGPLDVSAVTDTLEPLYLDVSAGDVIAMSGATWSSDMWVGGPGHWVTRLDDLDGLTQWGWHFGMNPLSTPGITGLSVGDASGVYAGTEIDGIGTHVSRIHRISLDGVGQGWVDAYVGDLGVPGYLFGLTHDHVGDVVAVYTDIHPSTGTAVTIDRRAPNLVLQSTGSDGQPPSEIPAAVTTNAAGTAFVVGRQGDDTWVRTFDPAGGLIWHAEDLEPGPNDLHAAAALSDGSFIAAGSVGAQGMIRRYGPCAP